MPRADVEAMAVTTLQTELHYSPLPAPGAAAVQYEQRGPIPDGQKLVIQAGDVLKSVQKYIHV